MFVGGTNFTGVNIVMNCLRQMRPPVVSLNKVNGFTDSKMTSQWRVMELLEKKKL